jgi:polysaccharide export outer membrane protein
MFRRHGSPLPLLLLLCAVVACSSRAPLRPPEPPEPAPAPGNPEDLAKWSLENVPRDYPLGPGDEIEVRVQGHPELTVTRKLPADGTLPIYLLNRTAGEAPVTVRASGKRIPELEEELRILYSKEIITPYVTVRAVSRAPKSFYVAGAVANPGNYPLPDDHRISLVQALTMAGWFAEKAADDRVCLMRIDPASGRRFFLPPIDVRRIVADADVRSDVAVEPGDTITVDSRESRPVYIFGHVTSPGEYPWASGMTLSRLITLAGGLKEFARTTDIRVLRPGPGSEPQVLRVDLEAIFDQESADLLLVPGDVIRIDERFI